MCVINHTLYALIGFLGFLPILVCHKQDLLQTFKRETDVLRQNYKSKSVSCNKLIREKVETDATKL